MFNNPDLQSLEIAAANGIGTARSLAKIHSLIIERKLLSDKMIERIRIPKYSNTFDWTLGEWQNKGYGFIYTKSNEGNVSVEMNNL